MTRTTLLTAGLACVVGVAAPVHGDDDPNARPTLDVIGGLHQTNLGEVRPIEFKGHVLSDPTTLDRGVASLLYAPTEADDPAYRDAISALIGGPVDYFDARAATPDLALMNAYDGVHTWFNFAAADTFLFGDTLAEYADGGGVVIMGAFCTYDSGNSLQGLIRTPAYSPVANPSGGNAFAFADWDGTSCGQGFYAGVASLAMQYRDLVVTQGSGIACGFYLDGEICTAYNGPGPGPAVYMANGSGGAPVFGFGEIPLWIANILTGGAGGGDIDCQCGAIYSVGDRVRAVVADPQGAFDLPAGSLGTAICGINPNDWVDPWILVEWDDWFNGHGGNGFCFCPPIADEGFSRWWVWCGDIEFAGPGECIGDLDEDGDTDVNDLLILLADWGCGN